MPLFHYGPTTCIPLSIIYLKYRLTTRWAGPPPYAWRRTRGSGCSLPRRQERSGTTMLLFFGKQKNIGNKRSSGASRARWWHWLAGWRNRRGTALGYVRRRRRKKRGEECWTRWSWTMSDVVKAKKSEKKIRLLQRPRKNYWQCFWICRSKSCQSANLISLFFLGGHFCVIPHIGVCAFPYLFAKARTLFKKPASEVSDTIISFFTSLAGFASVCGLPWCAFKKVWKMYATQKFAPIVSFFNLR